MSKTIDYKFKIIIVGDSGVGKTCMVAKFLGNPIPGTYVQTEEKHFSTSFVQFQNKCIGLELWDFSGADNYRTLTAYNYKGAQGAIICYSMTDKESLGHLMFWKENVELYATDKNEQCERDVKMLVVGLKSDSKKVCLNRDEGDAIAKNLGCKHFVCSCKGKEGFKEVFNELLTQMVAEAQLRTKERSLQKGLYPSLVDASTPLIKKESDEAVINPGICDCGCKIS